MRDVSAKREQFESLFLTHERAVRAYALRRAPAELAADVVSETFLTAWRRFDSLPGEPLPWLYGTARKVLANQRRRAEHQTAVAERVAREPGHGAFDIQERVGESHAIREALAALGDRDRETLMLVAWEDLGPAAAARAAGCTKATFAVRLHRARGRLEHELARASTSEPMEAS